MYVIEAGIPAPPKAARPRRKWVYPFPKMKVGESFLLQTDDPYKVASARVCACQYARRSRKSFASRTVEGGVRFWRIV